MSEFQAALAERRAAYVPERGGWVSSSDECPFCQCVVSSTAPEWAMRQHLEKECKGPRTTEDSCPIHT